MRKLFKPGFRQAGIGSVLELHITLAPHPGLPDFFQRQGLAFVIDADVERKPLVFFIAPDFGHDCGLGRAHLVAGKGFFAIDTIAFDKRGVKIQQKGDGLFRLQEPELVGARLELHAGQFVYQLGFLVLMAAHKIGLAVAGIAACLEIGIWPGQGEFAVFCLVNIVDFEGQQAALLIQKKLGIIGCRLKNRFHELQKLAGLVKLARRQLCPDAVEKFRNLVMGHDWPLINQVVDKRGVKPCLHRVKIVLIADPERHLPVECDWGFLGMLGIRFDWQRGTPLALQHDIETETAIVQVWLELQGKRRAFDAAGLVRFFPEQVIFLAHGPEKPRGQAVGNFHPVPVIIQMLADLLCNLRQLGRKFAPFGILDNLLKGNFVMHGGKAGLVLTAAEK